MLEVKEGKKSDEMISTTGGGLRSAMPKKNDPSPSFHREKGIFSKQI